VRAEFESCLHEGREIEVEFRVVWPDGSVRWLKDRGRAILDSNGRPLFLTGAAMDITERRWAEAALRESEARLRLAQEVTGIGTWEWDPDTGENLWMPEKYALFGLDPARDGPMTYTRLLDEVVHPDDRAKVEAALGEALATGGPYECVFRAYRRRPDGEQETCWIIARGRRIPRANGAPGRMLGVTVDITERQATEARLQKLQAELLHVSRLSAAGEMAAALAHELNQPLTAIASAIGAARRILASAFPSGSQQKAEAELRAAMDFAAEQALRGGQIVRRLRDFVTRGEADQRLQDTGKLIEEAGALALVGTRESGIEASFRFAPQLPPVRVDRIQIQQVLLNLIRNAIEAMTQEGAAAEAPRRELVVAAVPTGAGEVEVSVADTGPGLPLEVADRLFEPFVTTKPDGMGVGLSICRTIVEAHGGRLWAEPNPGGGTVFRFRLPVVLSDRVA
jgi:two-component system sensor kinase FixL